MKPAARKSRTFGRHGLKEVRHPASESRILKLPDPPSITVLICETGSYYYLTETDVSSEGMCKKALFCNNFQLPIYLHMYSRSAYISTGFYHPVVHFSESLSSALNLPLEKLRFLDIFICLWLPSWAIRYIPFENILTFHHSNVRSVYKFRDFIKTTSFVDCNWIEQRQFLVLALLSQLLLGWYFDLQPTCKNAHVVSWGCSYMSSLEGCVLKISIFSWSSKPIYL